MKHLILLAPILLTACGPKEVPVSILPPAELATCADMPEGKGIPGFDWDAMKARALAAGTPEIALDSLIAEAKEIVKLRGKIVLNDNLIPLRAAYGSCRGKVDGYAAWRANQAG